MPVGVLIVLVLGAIAVDLTVVHLASAQATDAASSAASDAVTVGLDQELARTDGTYVVDPQRATAAAWRAVQARRLPHDVLDVAVTVGPAPDRVTVRVTVAVAPIFGSALPGSDGHVVSGEASATAVRR